MFWRIITESREEDRPGITADAAYNEVATDLMLKQYTPRTIETRVLAASEHSLFKLEKDAEEEETRGRPKPLLPGKKRAINEVHEDSRGTPTRGAQSFGLGIGARGGLQ
jgi:hypothetical protein